MKSQQPLPRLACVLLFVSFIYIISHTLPAFYVLTKLVKDISHKVVANGGIVRSIQNHGIRDLPHRFRSKFPDKEGVRYYEKGRFISVYYDASPTAMKEVETVISRNNVVLRSTHIKARNKLWEVNIAREDKNRWIQKVLAMEEAEKMTSSNERP